MESRLIQFHAIEKDFLPQPYPASRAVPEWLKEMPPEAPAGAGMVDTVKQCSPFLDAITSGYIIPLSGDVEFAMDDGGQLTCKTPDLQAGVGRHPAAQVVGSPWEGAPMAKFLNPWILVTPPGYSTLFVQPLNRSPIPFTFFSGIVETDSFYREVNFPAACTMARGTSFTMPKGTPLMQVIPFKRDDWQSEIHPANAQRLAEMQRQVTMGHGVYRDWFHEKKTYG